MMSKYGWLIAVAVGFASGPTVAGEANTERLRAVITSDMPEGVAPGCVMGVFRAGKVEELTAAGYADLNLKIPLDADTLFYAGSVSKQFTALSVAKLVEAGRMGLDDDVRRYLPELPNYERPVTVRMLMLHTSGIRDSLGLLWLAGLGSPDKGLGIADNREDELQLIFRQKSTDFTPGTKYNYANSSYVLLARIVERISGKPFAEFVKREVLEPIGMEHSFFLNGSLPATQNVAHGYVKVKSGKGYEIRDTYPHFALTGAGGLMLTLNDLARYEYDIEVGHKVWTPTVRKIMLTPGTLTNGQLVRQPGADGAAVGGLGYGGGLAIGWYRGQYVVRHEGGWPGFHNVVMRFPERRIGVGVLCNSYELSPSDKAIDAVKVMEGDIFGTPINVEDAELPGRYYSEEVQAYYDLALKDDVLTVAIMPKSGTQTKVTDRIELKRDYSRDGTFKYFDINLMPYDHGSGFSFSTGRISGLQFRKVTANDSVKTASVVD